MTSQSGESDGPQVTLNAFEKRNKYSEIGEFRLDLPEPLKDDFKNRIRNINATVQGTWGKEALDAATEALNPEISLVEGSESLQLFVHLICLQNLGLLPGYPRYTRTIEDSTTPLPIKDYCSTHPEFKGTISAEAIEESEYIERHRLYRSKIYSVTDQFWIETNLVRWLTQWAWETYSSADFDPSKYEIQAHEMDINSYYPGYKEYEYSTTAIFDDSGAHNVTVAETREWLSRHSRIDTTVVPYMVEAPNGIVEIEGIAPDEPRWSPYWMFDIGVLSGGTVEILGNIIGNESASEIRDQLKRTLKTANAALVVMPSRDELHRFLAHGSSNGWFTQNVSPISDVVEYYERQPSLRHVNQELRKQSPDFQNTVFLSRKQILDGFVEPHEIIPSSLFTSLQ